jgi:small conductance mechanosensitive channel
MDNISITLQQLLANFLAFLPRMVIALLIFVCSLYAAGLLSKIVRRTMEKRKTDNEIMLLIVKITRWSVLILGTVAALQQVGFNLTAFLAGLGILGFTIGFALQDVSKNFVAGLLLLLEQPFDIGDTIEVSDYIGTVATVELRATEIYTFDGQNVLIPNADVFTNPIKNYSRYSKRRFDLSLGVAYDADLELARATILEVLATLPGLLSDPAPWVVYHKFGESSIDLTAYYWVDLSIGDYNAAIDTPITGITAAFAEKGIEIPYPTRSVILAQ